MSVIVGIDEVGRGSWAGPLVAGAVIINKPIAGLKDSKKLTKIQRRKLAKQINDEAMAVGIGWVFPADIDSYGLTDAIRQAMGEALSQISVPYDQIIIDGHLNFLSNNPFAKSLIKADDSVPCVSAASIVAKVARDNYMTDMAVRFPEYGFERHVGYGTKMHHDMLKQFGVCAIHRKSYKPIRVLLGSTP